MTGTCPNCRRIFVATVRARVVRDPIQGRRFLLVPLPDPEDWSLPDAVLHMNLGFAKLLKEVRRGMEQVGAFAGASKDKRGEGLFAEMAVWISGILEYTEYKDIASFNAALDRRAKAKEEE